MRKLFTVAGILLVAALTCARPSKADTVDFTLTGGVLGTGGASFSLPSTFTPVAANGSSVITGSVTGTLLGGAFTYSNIQLGLGSTHWAFGSSGVPGFPGTVGAYFGVFAPNLFTMNLDGTVTLNEALIANGFMLTNNMGAPIQVSANVIPEAPVGTPEPASLMLLGMGGAALVGLRRRKTA